MRIGILGRTGRMGRLLAEEIEAAGYDVGYDVGGPPIRIPRVGDISDRTLNDPAALARECDAVLDFTHADAIPAHAAALAAGRAAWILGTSGLSGADEAMVAHTARHVPVVFAPSFAPGVTLLLALAERAAASLSSEHYDAEITEMHHRGKVDAPSGTAIGIGRAVAAGRGVDLNDVAIRSRDGHTGPRPAGGIGFASLRGGQVIGKHELIFAGANEQIVLSHEAFDRRVFATGAVRAAAWAVGRPAGLYTMRDVLGLPAA